MKIAILSSHTPSIFWFRMDMMKEFLSRGHEVYAIANEPEELWKQRFFENGITYRQIITSRNSVNPLQDLHTFRSIKQILREIQPDKLFTFQAKTVIYGGIAANLLGIKETYPLIAGVGSLFLKDDLRTKLLRRVLVTEYKLGMKHSAAVFFQNTDDEKTFRDYGIIRKQKVQLLNGSGVNVDHFLPADMPDSCTFLCISRLIRDKGVYEYLQACREIRIRHPQVRCLLVGPYDTNPSALKPEELQQFVEDGSIEYFGNQDDVRPFLAQCSVYVLPSYREGTPKTVLEAMACGRAVITTDVPGCRETVKDGENGFLIPAKDVGALIEKMEYMLGHREDVVRMGRIGRSTAEAVFDVRKVNAVICDIMGV